MLVVNVSKGLERVKDGLVDYVASAMLINPGDGESYPVTVGFCEYCFIGEDAENCDGYVIRSTNEEVAAVYPEYIFIKSGFTSKGNRVERETVKLSTTNNFKLEIPEELEII